MSDKSGRAESRHARAIPRLAPGNEVRMPPIGEARMVPALIEQQAVVSQTDVDPPPEFNPATDDGYVPPDIEQRLLNYWLMYGPSWKADIIEQADVINPLIPVFSPVWGVQRQIRARL